MGAGGNKGQIYVQYVEVTNVDATEKLHVLVFATRLSEKANCARTAGVSSSST